MTQRRDRGLRVRREVLGDEHVDRATADVSPLDEAFQEYITGAAWADVWARDGLERPTRSLVTLAVLAALGHQEEFEMHLRASRRTGVPPEQIVEVLLHVALYAGLPAANTAFVSLKRVLGSDADGGRDGWQAGEGR